MNDGLAASQASDTAIAARARPFLAARVATLGVGLVSAVLTARYLGPEGRGQLALFLTIGLFGGALFGLGAPIASYDLVAHDETIRRRVQAAVAALAILAGVGSAGVGIVAFGRDDLLAASLGATVSGGLVASSIGMVLLASHQLRKAALLQVLPSVFGVIAFLVALVIFGGTWRDAAVAYALASLLLAAVALSFVPWSRATLWPLPLRELLGRGLRVVPGDVANLLSYRADTFLLAILAGPGPLGRYATGVQLVEPNWIAASALSAAIMASARLRSTDRGTLESLARVDEEGNRELATAVRGAAMVAAGGTGAVAVVLFLTGGAVFGPGFQTLPMIVLGLLPGIASLAVSKVIAGAVIARRRIGIGSLVAAASVSANVVANLVLIPRFAEIGAAFASSISYALSALLWMLAWKRSGGRLRLRDLAPRRADLSVIYSLLPTTALSRRARLPGR